MIIVTESKPVKEVAGIQKGISAKGLLPILARLNGTKVVYCITCVFRSYHSRE
jgi:hypothetical protein